MINLTRVKDFNSLSENYFKEIGERGKKSKVYKSHQLFGLQIAQLLDDNDHKSLYMRLAKKYDNNYLMTLAKTVSENNNVKNKGAYFMSVLFKK